VIDRFGDSSDPAVLDVVGFAEQLRDEAAGS
jgi:hypothetical protein